MLSWRDARHWSGSAILCRTSCPGPDSGKAQPHPTGRGLAAPHTGVSAIGAVNQRARRCRAGLCRLAAGAPSRGRGLGLVRRSGSVGFLESFIGDRVGFRGSAEFGEFGRNSVCLAGRR